MSSVMEISEILDRINRVTGRFEREAVEAAIVRQHEITPELLEILEKLLRVLENAPEMYAHIDALGDYTAHLYAMFVLGEFGETRAHQLLLRFAALPGDLLDSICGHFLDGGFAIALERTAESTRGLRWLIENRAANERVRICALEALECLVRYGRVERAVVVLYFRELFNGKLERTRSRTPAVIDGVNEIGSDSQRAGAPGEGRAQRESDRAKPQEKSIRILRPSPYPLPEGEGRASAIPISSQLYRLPLQSGIPAIQHC